MIREQEKAAPRKEQIGPTVFFLYTKCGHFNHQYTSEKYYHFVYIYSNPYYVFNGIEKRSSQNEAPPEYSNTQVLFF